MPVTQGWNAAQSLAFLVAGVLALQSSTTHIKRIQIVVCTMQRRFKDPTS